jgi:hypothetical protein
MMNWKLFGGRDLLKVLSRNLSEATEENREKFPSG